MQQYLVVVIAIFSHHGSTNLTQSHAVSPSGTGQYKSLWHAFCINIHAVYHEGRAVEMRVAQCASYLQFLTLVKERLVPLISSLLILPLFPRSTAFMSMMLPKSIFSFSANRLCIFSCDSSTCQR